MLSLKFKIQEYLQCKNCLKINPEEDAKFCIFCGKGLNHPARQRLDYIYSKNPAIIVALLAKVAKADDKIITKDLSKFISSLLDKIEMFYSKEYSGFRNTYARFLSMKKIKAEASMNFALVQDFTRKKSIFSYVYCLI